jgi:membrane protease YdiL (CAAX protease family)
VRASTRSLEPNDSFAEALRGFGPLGILAILVIILVGNFPVPGTGGLLVLLWAYWSRTPWRDLGFVRPTSWPRDVASGILLGIALKFLMKALVMPLLGAPPVNAAFHYLAGNAAALPGAIFLMVVGAGFGEETQFRGFLFERLGKLLGPGGRARTAIVLVSAVLFGLKHYPGQGWPGVEQATMTGLVFGAIVARTGRLWTVMCAHAAFDLAAVWMIYTNHEAAVAHLIFK